MGVVAFIMKQPPLLMKVHLHESGKKCLPMRSCFFQVMLALCLVISQSLTLAWEYKLFYYTCRKSLHILTAIEKSNDLIKKRKVSMAV